ncbi:Uncharacterised protein [Dermatophilus congolensis]|uniref:Uncharacterized protein n=1 Tax=Dermatophilus congolensis TaxID=1863 RepID=A0A239VTP4_9MICO|nr:Uncharacterised protein [Dermatophilus congolensis]
MSVGFAEIGVEVDGGGLVRHGHIVYHRYVLSIGEFFGVRCFSVVLGAWQRGVELVGSGQASGFVRCLCGVGCPVSFLG